MYSSHWLVWYRWILRALLKKVDPRLLFDTPQNTTPLPSEILATQQRRIVEEALSFLRNWVKDPQVTSYKMKLFITTQREDKNI
jgi:hypothetical protein